jgi:hypothetical protein
MTDKKRSHKTRRATEHNFMISVRLSAFTKAALSISGKSTYGGFSRDEGTSMCMRISAGSRGAAG